MFVRKEVIVALLVIHALLDDTVVGAVVGEKPVLDQSHEHRTPFPPSTRQFPRFFAGLVPIVIRHHIISGGRGGALNRLY